MFASQKRTAGALCRYRRTTIADVPDRAFTWTPSKRRASRRQLAAVDLDDLSDDVSAQSLGGEEQIGADAFLGRSNAANRNRLAHRLHRRSVGIPLMERRPDHPRGNRVDADLLADQLLGVTPGDRGDETFGRGVEHCPVGAAVSRRNRGRIDDEPALALEPGHGGAGYPNDRARIQI